MTIQLAPKFNPYILNRMTDVHQKHLCMELTNFLESYQGQEEVLYPDCAPNWVLKGPSKDILSESTHIEAAADQHIYRVRKAVKINAVIEKLGLTKFCVLRKYLLEFRGKIYVVAFKVTGTPLNSLNQLSSLEKAELVSIILNANHYNLVPKDYIRLENGKIAIVDTQPIGRRLYKKITPGILNGGIVSKPLVKKTLKAVIASSTALEVAKNDPHLIDKIKPLIWKRVALFAAYAFVVLASMFLTRDNHKLMVATLITAGLLAIPFYFLFEADLLLLMSAYMPELIGNDQHHRQ